MDLCMFHYHLLPGGVTDVILRSVEALSRFPGPVRSLTLVSGSEENLDAIRDRLRRIECPFPLTVEAFPEIGYRSRSQIAAPDDAGDAAAAGPVGQVSNAAVRAGADAATDHITRVLEERYAGRAWWIHNHHLGKNPAFTRAVFRLAEAAAAPVVFHVHDFPECGRYANLRYLHAAGIENLYPQPPAVRYVAINRRDTGYLGDAGIDRPAHVPNPVPPQTDRHGPATDREARADAVRAALGRAFGTTFPMYAPERPLVLYPIRTIRRKNVLEAALLANLARSAPNLVVTLPGVSTAERPYSDLVERAFGEGLVPGLWGIGRQLESAGLSFEDLIGAAAAFVSTSVQEGFGFQFITPLAERVPIVGRRLAVLTDIAELYEDTPARFYDTLRVPWTTPALSDPRVYLRFRYDERIRRISARLPERAIANLEGELEALLAGEAVDFSYLPPEMQFAHLRASASDGPYRERVRALNDDLVTHLDGCLGSPMPDRSAAIEQRFGYRAVAERMTEILTAPPAARAPGSAPDDPAVTAEAFLLERFATLEYQRLLYE